MLEKGESIGKVALHFRLSLERVEQIRVDPVKEMERRKRMRIAQAQIRQANDIERRWPVAMVLTAFDLKVRPHNCLESFLIRDWAVRVKPCNSK